MSDDVKIADPVRDPDPWRCLCLGTVVRDNIRNDLIIEVWLANRQNQEDGVLTTTTPTQQKSLDLHGSVVSSQVERKSTIKATWWPTEDGRVTPPNVCEGETVEIWQYGTKRPYYWKARGGEPALRGLEHVVHAASNLPTGREAFARDSSYGTTVSTRDQYINIWTSMSNGEKFAYNFFMDTALSRMGFHDNIGNMFGISSALQGAFIRSAAGAYVQTIGADVEMKGARILADGKFYVSELIVDSIKANRVEGTIINRPVGESTSLEAMPFEPFMDKGDKDTSGPDVAPAGGAASAKAAMDQKSMDALELRVRRLEDLHELGHEV